jgi:hypothetical protein
LQQTNATLFRSSVGACRDATGLRPRLLAAVLRSDATLAFAAERQVVRQQTRSSCGGGEWADGCSDCRRWGRENRRFAGLLNGDAAEASRCLAGAGGAARSHAGRSLGGRNFGCGAQGAGSFSSRRDLGTVPNQDRSPPVISARRRRIRRRGVDGSWKQPRQVAFAVEPAVAAVERHTCPLGGGRAATPRAAPATPRARGTLERDLGVRC